jgi:hypothetical protein
MARLTRQTPTRTNTSHMGRTGRNNRCMARLVQIAVLRSPDALLSRFQ